MLMALVLLCGAVLRGACHKRCILLCSALSQLGCLLECEATLIWLQATLWGAHPSGGGWVMGQCGVVWHGAAGCAVSCSPLLLPAVFAKQSANAGVTEQPVQNVGSWFGCTAWGSSRADPWG